MVTRSDSELGALLTLAVLFWGFVGVLTSMVLLLSRKFRTAAKVLLVSAGAVGVYVGAVLLFSLLAPQRIVNIGDSYCMDIWCIGIERVDSTPHGREILYKIGVRIFSDAGTVKVSAKGATPYLLDERGRRFELINDPSVIPFDAPLDPAESIRTTLTFAAPADAQHLFLPCSYHLIGDEASVPFWVKLYFGNDAGYLHKRTVLRVL
jgi:hypothetical protein